MTTNYFNDSQNQYQSMEKTTLKLIGNFQKSVAFKQLGYCEQQFSEDIIAKFAEYMFDYHFQNVVEWETIALQDVLVTRFPENISAPNYFFNCVESVLTSFFLYVYESDQLPQGIVLADSLPTLCELMLDVVATKLELTKENQLFALADELAIDTDNLSDIEKLYMFVEHFRQQEIATDSLLKTS